MKRLTSIAVCAALLACSSEVRESIRSEAIPAEHALTPSDLPAFFDCLRENGQAIVSAHRGGPAPGYAENALGTMERTLLAGPAFLEIDIARTRDGELVLMHDDEVDRTTNGIGRVRDLTLEQFQALRLEDETGSVLGARPPTLREALAWAAGKTVLELDVKRGVSYEDVVAAVYEADAIKRVIFITYSTEGATRIAGIAPDAMLYATVESVADLDALEQAGVDLSRVIAWTGTREPNSALNIALAQRGVEARFGTLGGDNSWDTRFVRDGVDQYAAFAETGIQIVATDRPAEAARDLDAHDGVDGHGATQCEAAQ